MLGVSPSADEEACEAMGPQNAAAAMACILERSNLRHSSISRPISGALVAQGSPHDTGIGVLTLIPLVDHAGVLAGAGYECGVQDHEPQRLRVTR
ncbi:replication initiation protein RepC [Rhizobium brockwellii]